VDENGNDVRYLSVHPEPTPRATLDISAFPSGSYFLQMETGEYDSQQMLNVVK